MLGKMADYLDADSSLCAVDSRLKELLTTESFNLVTAIRHVGARPRSSRPYPYPGSRRVEAYELAGKAREVSPGSQRICLFGSYGRVSGAGHSATRGRIVWPRWGGGRHLQRAEPGMT